MSNAMPKDKFWANRMFLTVVFMGVLLALALAFSMPVAQAAPSISALLPLPQTLSIPLESLNKAVSLLFPGVPDDTVEVAIKFANTLNAEPERYAGFFGAVGNAFVSIGQGADPQLAIVEVVRSQPELSAWHDSHGGSDPQPAIIVVVIIIILVCVPLFAR
jgi:hypothetical protein